MKDIFKLFQAVVLIFTISLVSNAIKADTTFVSGDIVNQNWRVSGSPYVVTNNIRVVGLSIDPGVSLLFDGNYEFLVEGVIEAIGSEQSPIIFTTKAGVASWKGIRFQDSRPGSYMKWCIVEKANNSGIQIVGTGSLPVFYNCTIRNNTASSYGGGMYISNTSAGQLVLNQCLIENNQAINNSGNAGGGGIYINPGNVEFVNCRFLKNRVIAMSSGFVAAVGGAIFKDDGVLSLRNCEIRENKASSFRTGGSGSSQSLGGAIVSQRATTTIRNCVIVHDSVISGPSPDRRGGGVWSSLGQTLIENCTIDSNNNYAVYREGSATITTINSIIYYNELQFAGPNTVTYSCVQGGYAGVGNISNAPIFDGCNMLIIGSPCIDAGNPSPIYNDACFPPSLGGLRNDMGAYGGPGACNWLYFQDPPCTPWTDPSINIELTALMEGLYNPATNLMVRPQVERMYLRNATSPYSIVEPAAATLGQNGISTSEFIFNSAPSGTYYLVIKNWNNLETWSKTGGELLYNDGETSYYDFTSASSQANGNNLKLIGSKWCTYTGSVTPDSSIDLADVLQINAASNAFTAGYNINDLNGDNQVNLTDLLIVYNNSAAFIRVKNPFNP